MQSEIFEQKKFRHLLLYVIGEIFLVVIGILLALQVDNWNEDRKTRNEEQTLLQGLKNEMADNLSQIEKVISYNKQSKDAARKLLQIFSSDYRQYKSNELDSLFAEVQWAWTFDPRVGILNSIKTNGKIGAIQNPAIQHFIASFEETVHDADEESLITRSIIVEKYVMLVSKYISLNTRVKYIGFDVGASKFPANYEGIFNDREIESLLTYIYVWRDTEIGELNEVKDMLLKNIAIVDGDVIR